MNSHSKSIPRGAGLNIRHHFSTTEAATMLKAAKPTERGLLALALFAGIRPLAPESFPALETSSDTAQPIAS